MIIKVCGMREPDNIHAVEEILAHYRKQANATKKTLLYPAESLMGFIFFDGSPRFVSRKPEYLPTGIHRVGVFVNESTTRILDYVKEYGLTYVQLHGNETPEQCRELRREVKVIKAFSVREPIDTEVVHEYEGDCDLYLFDTPCEGYGGSGQQFDWSALHAYHGKTPFLLSGGIGPGLIGNLKAFHHPSLAGYDLNSRFETAPALKDTTLLNRFLNRLQESCTKE